MLDTLEIGEGTVLADRYEVVRRLGAGGMATVYLAEDRILGRSVAVKRLRGERDEADLERFRREARLGAALSHANLVTVFDTFTGDDGVLIVMEYVEGETLADAIERGPLDDERAIEVLSAVAAALDHAHSNGIVHRDVKPANVLLGDNGSVKLADLGIATAAEASRITMTHDIVGTLAYIAPERLDSPDPGGPAVDVYGLAVLAYETLGGERLSRGSTPAAVVHNVSTGPPPDLRDAWPQAPPAAAEVLQAGMDADPAGRPPSAGELVRELAHALRERGEPTERLAPPPPPPDAQDPVPRRSAPRLAIAAMVVVGLTGLAALAFAIAGGGDEPGGESALIAGEDQGGAERPGNGGGGDSNGAGSDAEDPPAAEEPAAEEPAASQEQASAPASGDPAALNDEGFALIQQGKPEEAIPLLEQAVDAYPEDSRDLTYAYALFNLGTALRQAGRPDEAIPVLERRLEIPNQTGAVRRELELAREQAGTSG